MRVLTPLANRLRDLRLVAGITQQELALRAGLSISVVFMIEQGKREDPRLSTLAALAQGLGVPLVELLLEQPAQAKPRPRSR